MTFTARFLPLLLLLPTLVLAASKEASREELAQIEQSIGKVQKEIAALNHQRSSVHGDVLNSEQAITKLHQKLDDMKGSITAEQVNLEKLRAQAAALKQQRRGEQEALDNYLRSAWINGRQEYLRLMLSQQNPGDAGRVSRYYQYFSDARTRAIASYNDLLGQIAAAETAVADTTTRLAEQQDALKQKRSQISEEQNHRQQLLSKLDTDLTDRSKQLNALEQQRVDRQLLLDELTRKSVETQLKSDAFATSKGRMQWPVQGKVLHGFGTRQELGDLMWEGTEIAAAAGTEVHAIHHGKVVFADWFGASGLLLIIDHGDGYMSLYAHNQQLRQSLGSFVQRGEVIASVGNTGGKTQPVLYFEIRHGGKAENPAAWIAPRK